MIESHIQPGGFKNWNDVPLSTKEEVLASQAAISFSAETSLSEKVQRVFNAAMFFLVGVKLLTFIPAVAAAGSTLSGMGFAVISGTTLLQIPAVVAIIAIAPKIIFTLALILVIRKIVAVAINHIIYQAVLNSLMNKQAIDNLRWENFEKLNKEKFECRRIALNKSGINYDTFVIEHEETKGNGQWVIMAGGNAQLGETTIGYGVIEKFKDLGLNVLYVNGPGVVRSTGFPTSYSIGAGQEAGLQFLEKVVEAKKILLYGLSLGGGAQAEAILSHAEFKKDIDYMVWSDRSFDKLSNAASGMVTRLAKPLFFLLGIELDGVASAKKLQKLGITHIVTQNSQDANEYGYGMFLPLDGDIHEEGDDDIIPNKASLYVGLKKAGIQDSERLKCYGGPNIAHNDPLPTAIQGLVEDDIKTFLA